MTLLLALLLPRTVGKTWVTSYCSRIPVSARAPPCPSDEWDTLDPSAAHGRSGPYNSVTTKFSGRVARVRRTPSMCIHHLQGFNNHYHVSSGRGRVR